jgi:hypothetical protein
MSIIIPKHQTKQNIIIDQRVIYSQEYLLVLMSQPLDPFLGIENGHQVSSFSLFQCLLKTLKAATLETFKK